MIQFQINGQLYDGFTSMSCKRSMDDFCGEFYFTAISETQVFENYPIKEGQACNVIVDGERWMTASIETLSVDYDETEITINATGREITADIIDSTVGPAISIVGPISLEDLINEVLSLSSITDIQVVNDAPNIEPFAESEIIKPSLGMSIHDFLESYARTRQVLLVTDNFGRLVFTRSSEVLSNTRLLNKVDGQRNNVTGASSKFDRTKRYGKYVVHSQSNGGDVNWYQSEFDPNASDEDNAAVVAANTNIFAEVIDPEIRPTRINHIISENPMTVEQCQERAAWECNISRARSIDYKCMLDGHSFNGVALNSNILHFIDDDFMGISAEMILSAVELVSDDKGNVAKVKFMQKDAYQLEALAPAKQKNTNDIGVKWYQEVFDTLKSGT